LEGLPERDGLRPATVLVDVVETVSTLISGDALPAEDWSAVTEALAKQIRLTNRFPA
jgi:hypothetical protein